MTRWLAPAGILALALAASAGAQPDPGATHASLTFVRLEGAAGCLSEAELAARVRATLGRPVWGEDAPVRVDGWIVRRRAPRSGFVAGVAFLGADDRVLRRGMVRTADADCSSLDGDLTRMVAGTLRALLPLPARGAEAEEDREPPSYNPYRSDAPEEAPPRRRRASARGERPLPNPYAGNARPEAELRTHFNPYRGSPAVARNGAVPDRTAAGTPAANPYLGPAAPPDAPGANPYRP